MTSSQSGASRLSDNNQPITGMKRSMKTSFFRSTIMDRQFRSNSFRASRTANTFLPDSCRIFRLCGQRQELRWKAGTISTSLIGKIGITESVDHFHDDGVSLNRDDSYSVFQLISDTHDA